MLPHSLIPIQMPKSSSIAIIPSGTESEFKLALLTFILRQNSSFSGLECGLSEFWTKQLTPQTSRQHLLMTHLPIYRPSLARIESLQKDTATCRLILGLVYLSHTPSHTFTQLQGGGWGITIFNLFDICTWPQLAYAKTWNFQSTFKNWSTMKVTWALIYMHIKICFWIAYQLNVLSICISCHLWKPTSFFVMIILTLSILITKARSLYHHCLFKGLK